MIVPANNSNNEVASVSDCQATVVCPVSPFECDDGQLTTSWTGRNCFPMQMLAWLFLTPGSPASARSYPPPPPFFFFLPITATAEAKLELRKFQRRETRSAAGHVTNRLEKTRSAVEQLRVELEPVAS